MLCYRGQLHPQGIVVVVSRPGIKQRPLSESRRDCLYHKKGSVTMYKMLYILIFSTLLFSCSDSENLDSTNSKKQDQKAEEEVDLLRLATVKIGDKWGYINPGGEVVIKPQFDDTMMFSDGLAAIKISDKWGYINPGGEVVIKPQFGYAGSFSSPAYTGSYLGPAYVGSFSSSAGEAPAIEGLAFVRIGYTGGFINREGKFFDNAGDFSEGLRRVKIGDKWGYVNQVGKIVIEPQFDDAYSFSKGLAAIKISDKWGYINHKGEIVIKPQFDDARSFSSK